MEEVGAKTTTAETIFAFKPQLDNLKTTQLSPMSKTLALFHYFCTTNRNHALDAGIYGLKSMASSMKCWNDFFSCECIWFVWRRGDARALFNPLDNQFPNDAIDQFPPSWCLGRAFHFNHILDNSIMYYHQASQLSVFESDSRHTTSR